MVVAGELVLGALLGPLSGAAANIRTVQGMDIKYTRNWNGGTVHTLIDVDRCRTGLPKSRYTATYGVTHQYLGDNVGSPTAWFSCFHYCLV